MFDLPININQNVFFDYIYVKDLIKVIDCFIENEARHKFYNIGTGKKIDLLTIAQKILQISGKNLPITVKNPRLNNEYTCDISRLSSEFSDLQYTNFEKSLEELFEYYKSIMPKIKKESL